VPNGRAINLFGKIAEASIVDLKILSRRCGYWWNDLVSIFINMQIFVEVYELLLVQTPNSSKGDVQSGRWGRDSEKL
jgi:hypothetical protein